MNALEIRDLCKQYPGFALEHLNLTLPGGCIMGLIGQNGAGKSTALHLVLNLMQRDGGTVRIFGKDNREDELQWKQDVGAVLDEPGIPGCMTAKEVGRMLRSVYVRWDDAAYRAALKRLSVPEEKRFEEMSRGTKMKLGLAAAFSHGAKLLILDEATNGLDPVVRDEILDMLNDFTRDETHSVLISSHIVSDLEKICDYIAFLHEGKLLLCEEKDVLRDEYGILRCPAAELQQIPAGALLRTKITPYGAEAIVRRKALPAGTELGTVDIEQLFVWMVREAK